MKVRFSATAIFGFHEKISLNEVSVIKKIVVDNSILIIIKKKKAKRRQKDQLMRARESRDYGRGRASPGCGRLHYNP